MLAVPRLIIGVDPGPVPGVFGAWNHQSDTVTNLTWLDLEFGFAQCDPDTLMDVLDAWVNDYSADRILIATETYVVGPRSGKSAHPSARSATQLVLDRVKDWADVCEIPRVTRPAAVVKPWATNDRLDAAQLLNRTVGCTHARDASRHLLYAGHHDLRLPDPFSTNNERA